MDKELNLLYALFAARLGDAKPPLIKGLLRAWQEDPSQGLPARAAQSGVINPEQSAMLVAMVKQAVQTANGNAAAAFQHFGGERALQTALSSGTSAAVETSSPWSMPVTLGAIAAAALAVIFLGGGWYSAASARGQLAMDYTHLEAGMTQLTHEVDHLRQRLRIAEDNLEQTRLALAAAEDDLAFERRRRQEAAAQAQAAQRPQDTQQAEIPAPDAPIQPLPWQQQASQQPISLNRQQLERQAGDLNAETVLRQLQPDLARDGQGRVVGITSNNFSSIPLAGQLGLQNGDVIANINGVDITGLGSYVAIEQAVRGGGPITVTILRNGQPLTATFNLR